MIEYDARPERAVLVAVLAQGADEERELAEMRELLRTAQVDIVATCVQHRATIHPRTYVGSGKLEELKELAKELEAEVIVTEDELSPSQQRVLEDELGMRVVDRTRVILDIFALHAHSAAGKLQVELAQLEYNLQRMRGMWKHLERLGGGVGTRGPGESQLETDRRLARTRISLLRRRLRELRKQRATMRRQRERNEVPSVALAGYTNVGKSTLLNALTGSEVSSADRLFETLDPTTRSYDYLGRTYLLTDTVGFVRKLPHQLVAAFASTLEETLLADLVLHVADASADEEERARQIAVGRERARRDRRRRDAAPARAQQDRPLQRGRAPPPARTAIPTPCSSRRARARACSTSSRRSASTSPAASSASRCSCRSTRAACSPSCTRSARRSSARTRAEGVLIRAHLPHALAERYASFRLVPTGA